MSAAARILDRLERVKPTGEGKWIAACPAHKDRSPSLSVREADGRVLLYDFGGCETSAVLSALGLQASDLFDKPLSNHIQPSHARIPARDLLEVVGHEIDVAGILLSVVVDGRGCTVLAWERLAQCSQRINAARMHANGR